MVSPALATSESSLERADGGYGGTQVTGIVSTGDWRYAANLRVTQRPVTRGGEIRDSEAELGRGWRIGLAGAKRGTMMCTVPLHHQTNCLWGLTGVSLNGLFQTHQQQ